MFFLLSSVITEIVVSVSVKIYLSIIFECNLIGFTKKIIWPKWSFIKSIPVGAEPPSARHEAEGRVGQQVVVVPPGTRCYDF
jgi:hypothetical protein